VKELMPRKVSSQPAAASSAAAAASASPVVEDGEIDEDEDEEDDEDEGDMVGALPAHDPLNNSLVKKDLRRLHQRLPFFTFFLKKNINSPFSSLRKEEKMMGNDVGNEHLFEFHKAIADLNEAEEHLVEEHRAAIQVCERKFRGFLGGLSDFANESCHSLCTSV
jgi:hypothetical protein